jgi:predicted ATPase
MGPNSVGKSSVIQAILLAVSYSEQELVHFIKDIVKPFSIYEDIKCVWSEEKKIFINLDFLEKTFSVKLKSGFPEIGSISPKFDEIESYQKIPLKYEDSFFYLSANRTGSEDISDISQELRIGHNGGYAVGYLENNKSKEIFEEIQTEKAYSKTLKGQLDFWLTYITDIKTDISTEKISHSKVKLTFIQNDIDNISSSNTGAGIGYLLKVLIMCLSAKKDDLLIIENPEIHLHPLSQSRLGEFLAFIASKGIYLIIETHCDHLINRIKYEVYKKKIKQTDVVIYYKGNAKNPFTQININQRGHFCDIYNKEISFPEGFFDATLKELLEIA